MVKKILLLLTFLVFITSLFMSKAERKVSLTMLTFSTHPLVFFDENTFYSGVTYAKENDTQVIDRISGGIVPHHLFPGFIIAEYFNLLSKQDPKTIILIGPNHNELGDYQVLTSLYGWETPFGTVEPELDFIQGLVKGNFVKIDEAVLPKEHSVAGIMPFIKYFLPSTKVVPIILSGFMDEDEILDLSNKLTQFLDDETVIVAAVDFSHNLSSQEAKEKDEITWQLMTNFEYQKILSLGNEYLDSPPAIALMLMAMKNKGKSGGKILQNTNSGEMQKNNAIETTSYFSIVY